MDQQLRVVGLNLEGDAVEWFRWMTRNNLITTWHGFWESVRNRFGPCKYEDPQGALSMMAKYQELLVSKPTSLGDTFALVTVTKARLDDQQVSIVSQAITVASRGASKGTQSSRISTAFSKGLCFNSDISWVCGHKCPGKFMTDEEEDTKPVTEQNQEDALEGGDTLILNSLVGYGHDYALKGEKHVANFPKDEHEGRPISGRPPEEATWVWLLEFKIAYPSYHLEDKVISEGEKNVTPGVPRDGRTKRTKSKHEWHKDYVM
uniref:Retrovirus-related Pol polyprotein from transposon opus n=1 Tax=Tanacetum cinerariifolium TaxID=118510 RepID=A0A699HJL1_TANCI|nr:retrovirus-related Pol polyprotein from transposon opus [Tanacetum cinerariifolium]